MATENPGDSLGSPTKEELAAIEDEDVLNKMLDNAKNFEERSMIRAALRDLLRRKIDKRKEERGERQADLKQQSKAAATGGGRSTFNQQTSTKQASAFTSFNKTTGPSAALPQKCPTAAAPNAKNVKQMLLDWCRAKTEPYEGVDIQNFSSSWKDGIAFCALVHRFFPDAFEYSILNPNKPRDNFQLAFSTAERLAGCPSLLDPDDLVRMHEPDWKCVYTYIQEFYRCLVEKGLVKTKKRP
ncbi:smoothelin [Boleophthalmus pectinirostris]|uniref:smoothelin n=1 Tax=Boleophthalmus pectinirostris TaxID=150288 RepID=UPI000A1C2032|nr:smoothelin [Boleophthalmus pectinirostris]XP_055009734.1 smoothelin [Boleophthalmus pectinirostris]